MSTGNAFGAVLNNPSLNGLISNSFSRTSSVCAAIGTQFDTAFSALSGAFSWVFDFVKFEVLQTYFQQLGLWFTRLNFPQGFSNAFHKIIDFISLVWDYAVNMTPLQIFYMWSFVSVIFFVIWVLQKQYDPKQEMLGPNEFTWEARGSLWNFWTYLLVTVCTTLYLPTITATFRVLFCFEGLMTSHELYCYSGVHWLHMGVATFVLIFIGLLYPYNIYLTILKYQPKPQMYDETGHLMDYSTDKPKILSQYRELLAKDKCPYSFLYRGYEYGWSSYKVFTMIYKILLIIPMIPFFTNLLLSTSVSLFIVTMYGLFSVVSTPFILPQDDWIDLSARVSAFLTIAIQVLVLQGLIYSPWDNFAIQSINIGSMIIMWVIIIGHMDFVRSFVHKKFDKLQFSPDMVYNHPLERRHRIWQRFWRGLFSTYGSLHPVYDRLMEMEAVFRKVGIQKYREALIPPNEHFAQARRMAMEIEGIDIYYKTSRVEDPSYWGKLYITPFPFSCNIVYDETNKIICLDDDGALDLYHQNCRDQKVINSKKLRQALRCLDGERVVFDYVGYVDVGCGCSKHTIEARFHEGVLKIQKRHNDFFSQGFRVTIEFDDGQSIDFSESQDNIHLTIGHDEIGINPDFTPSPGLLKLLNDPQNNSIIRRNWEDVIQRQKLYREDIEEIRRESEEILSNNFWILVFLNDHCPLEELTHYLQNFESNTNIHDMVNLYEDDIKGMYSRLKFFDTHPSIATWYCFFDDVSLFNSDLQGIIDHPELFDMSRPTALTYHPCTVSELRVVLENAGLRTSNGEGYFTDEILDKLEEKLEKDGQAHYTEPPPYVSPISKTLLADSSCMTTPLLSENTSYLLTATMCAWT